MKLSNFDFKKINWLRSIIKGCKVFIVTLIPLVIANWNRFVTAGDLTDCLGPAVGGALIIFLDALKHSYTTTKK